MPPKINQGVPQKTVRDKSKEEYNLKRSLEREKRLREVLLCAVCGTGIRAEEQKKNGDLIFKHISIEKAAKHGPHFPRKADNAGDNNNTNADSRRNDIHEKASDGISEVSY